MIDYVFLFVSHSLTNIYFGRAFSSLIRSNTKSKLSILLENNNFNKNKLNLKKLFKKYSYLLLIMFFFLFHIHQYLFILEELF